MVEDYDVELLHCDWCGKLMTYDETSTSEFIYTGTGGATVHLCWADRDYVTKNSLDVDGQMATDKATRDAEFAEYIANAINPELSDLYQYPWY